jgi:hypothetical protein
MPLPDFVIIGAMKCGTTTLDSNLRKHPEICMSKYKEPDFFNKNFHKPLMWYKKMFQQGKQICGEASPNYAKRHINPNTVENMYKVVPNAKLIFIVRDPIDRIISHLHHDLYRDRLSTLEIQEKIFENEDYIKSSSYFYQISEYLKYYDRQNILFLSFDELKFDLRKTLNKITSFLGLTPFPVHDDFIVTNKTSNKYIIKYYDRAHARLPARFWKLYHYIFYFLNWKCEKPMINNSTKKRIKMELLDDINKFKTLVGNSYENWDTFNDIN